jgi:hypothetical protein
MNTQVHSNQDEVVLPLPPHLPADGDDMALYARFMRHLRNVPNSRMEIKVLSAIQFTADMLGHSDAHVAKLLVDLGLRAPRMAFPADFLKYASEAMMRSGWEVGAPTHGLIALHNHWNRTGEDRFAAFRGEYTLIDERIYY